MFAADDMAQLRVAMLRSLAFCDVWESAQGHEEGWWVL